MGQRRQGLARLIDSYAEGLLAQQAFDPRITRLRQRLTALEEQAQQLRDATALQDEFRLIMGRLADCAIQVPHGLEGADWTSKRELMRALVKRVDVAQDQVKVVCRVDQRSAAPSSGKKSLQLRRGSNYPTLWATAE
jgi:site-specific DNA recombinase